MKKIIFLFLLTILGFTSCNQDTANIIDAENQALTEEQNIMKETSILIGRLLSDKDVRNEVLSKMKKVDDNGDIVSFAYLLQDEKHYKKNEIVATNANKQITKTNNLFKNALVKEFAKNKKDYQSIKSNMLKGNTENRLITDIVNDLTTSLTLEGLQIYYPYDPEFINDDTTVTDFYVSYDPLNGALTNEAFKFFSGAFTNTVVPYEKPINNDFLDTNPVFVVVPIDPCDIQGSPCGFETLEPVAMLPPPLVGASTLLTYNVNHNNIPENDIISTVIPQIKVKGTSWMGFAGTHQKLRFFRTSAGKSASVTQNADGTITATAFNYKIKDVRIRRKYVRKSKWVGFDTEFDPDWNMSENTQVITVFSLHHLKGKANIDVSVKSGLKFVKGVPTATPEASVSSKINISTGSAKFRANKELSRRQVLATIVGGGDTGKTIIDNGINYNVKEIGIVDFYYKHYYTDLTH
jgi:hypothetical protein